MRAVDAVGCAAEHQVVARRAPGRLLGDLDIGHAVLGEEALLLGDDQRRGIGQRDVAELGAGDFGARALREDAAREANADGAQQAERARALPPRMLAAA